MLLVHQLMEAGRFVYHFEPAKNVKAVEACLRYIEQPPLKMLKYENDFPRIRIRTGTGSRSPQNRKNLEIHEWFLEAMLEPDRLFQL